MTFGQLFPAANIFSWVGIDFMYETDYKTPNPTKLSENSLSSAHIQMIQIVICLRYAFLTLEVEVIVSA